MIDWSFVKMRFLEFMLSGIFEFCRHVTTSTGRSNIGVRHLSSTAAHRAARRTRCDTRSKTATWATWGHLGLHSHFATSLASRFTQGTQIIQPFALPGRVWRSRGLAPWSATLTLQNPPPSPPPLHPTPRSSSAWECVWVWVCVCAFPPSVYFIII